MKWEFYTATGVSYSLLEKGIINLYHSINASIHLFNHPFIQPSFINRCLTIYLFVTLSVWLRVRMPVCFSVCLCIIFLIEFLKCFKYVDTSLFFIFNAKLVGEKVLSKTRKIEKETR